MFMGRPSIARVDTRRNPVLLPLTARIPQVFINFCKSLATPGVQHVAFHVCKI